MEAGVRAAAAPAVPVRAGARTLARDLLTLTKPKVQSLLLFTTVTTMYVAGDPSLGLSGMPRRIYEYPADYGWSAYNLISTVGSFVLALGVLVTVVNVVRSLRSGVIAGPDPWKGNTLEWFTSSPPPANNFDVIPRVRSVEPMKDIRRQVELATEPAYAEGPTAPERTPA